MRSAAVGSLRVRRERGSAGFLLAAALLAAAPAPAAADADPPPALTLESAVRHALSDNRELARLAAAHEGALFELGDAAADFAVRVRPDSGVSSAAGATTRQFGLALLKKLEWGTEIELGGRFTATDVEGDGDAARRAVRVAIAQPLFRYAGREAAREPVARAESRVRASLRRLELAKADLVLQVAQAYYDVFRLEAQLRVEEAALERLDRHRRLTEVRVRQGRASPVDALRVESQQGDAAARARAARERVAARRLDLGDLLGLAPDAGFELAPPPWTDGGDLPLGEALASAQANRLDLAQVEQDCRDVQRGLRLARRGLLPDLRLVAAAERSGDGASLAGALDETAWSVGLQAGGDLGGGRERRAFDRAQLDERSAREDLETARRFAERQVRREHLAWERARAEVEPAARNRAVAETRLRLARRLFERGRGDSFSVTDAEQQFQQSEAAALSARTDAAIAGLRLRRAAGTLLEAPAELKPERGPDGDPGIP